MPTDGAVPTEGAAPAEGPVVLVSGATGGIGRAVTLAYAARGARLVLAGRSTNRLDQLATACLARGSVATAAVTDVADPDSVAAAVDLAVERYGGLDIVVHSAAVAAYGRVTQVPQPVWDQTLDIGVHGTSNVARESLRVFERAGSGTLVIIGSLLGQATVPNMGAYVTSKWAVRGLVRVLQQEARTTPGVHVLMVSPGGVATSIYQDAATYVGHSGSPPPPVLSPEAVARRVLRSADTKRRQAAAGPANGLIRLGFTLAPWVYDGLAGPLVARFALGKAPRPATEGNVFRPSEDITD